jgi:hypothetical protein
MLDVTAAPYQCTIAKLEERRTRLQETMIYLSSYSSDMFSVIRIAVPGCLSLPFYPLYSHI